MESGAAFQYRRRIHKRRKNLPKWLLEDPASLGLSKEHVVELAQMLKKYYEIRVINRVELNGCFLCPAAFCFSRHLFIESGTGYPLKCDMCGEPPDPRCVKVCFNEAPTQVLEIVSF